MTRLLLLAVALAAAGCGSGNDGVTDPVDAFPPGDCRLPPVAGTPPLTTVRVAAGLVSPVDLQSAPGDRARIFIVEQPGRIRILRGGALVPTPFLDIVDRVGSGGERGLLGLAFHPQFPQNGRFFVNYTDRAGDTHIAEFRAAGGADTV